MSIPLVQNNEKDSINTSLIVIKRQIERINMLLGLSNSEEIDTSVFATKEELQDAITELSPVDEVTADNLQSVTSDAVAETLSYAVTEQLTGGRWRSNQPIYKKTIDLGYLPNNTEKKVAHNINNLDQVISLKGMAKRGTDNCDFPLPYLYIANSSLSIQVYVDNGYISISTGSDRRDLYGYVTIEYTKTIN